MQDLVKIRHSIAVNRDTQKTFPVSFDGRDTKGLREDFLGLEGLDLDKCLREKNWLPRGKGSQYFQALHQALDGLGDAMAQRRTRRGGAGARSDDAGRDVSRVLVAQQHSALLVAARRRGFD